MTVFAAALTTLLRDPNLSAPATLRVEGQGAPVALRVSLTSPEVEGPVFGGDIIRPDALIIAAKADYARPRKGDVFAIAGRHYTVRAWREDAEGLSWTIEATR